MLTNSFLHRLSISVAVCLALLAFAAMHAQAASTSVVISQVYGGGGNGSGSTAAPYTNDFIELFNLSSSEVDISGWSVQYASASGTDWSNMTVVPANTKILPGQYFLIKKSSGGSAGSPLPSADLTGSINLSASSAKVALVNSSVALSGSCPSGSTIIDMIGYGSASCKEGSVAPGLSNTKAAIRAGGGCTDSDNNGADFSAAAPNPRNNSAPTAACGAPVSTPPSATGTANPSLVDQGANVLLSVTVVAGTNPASTSLAVKGDLTSIGGLADQAFDNGGSGFTYTLRATIDSGLAVGPKTIPITVTDAEGRSGTAAISLEVAVPPVAAFIHDILAFADSAIPVLKPDTGILCLCSA